MKEVPVLWSSSPAHQILHLSYAQEAVTSAQRIADEATARRADELKALANTWTHVKQQEPVDHDQKLG